MGDACTNNNLNTCVVASEYDSGKSHYQGVLRRSTIENMIVCICNLVLLGVAMWTTNLNVLCVLKCCRTYTKPAKLWWHLETTKHCDVKI